MSVQCITDLKTFLLDNSERIYRFYVYKKAFTPYEVENKFTDESRFEDSHYTYGMIRESVELPDGDVLLGIQELYDELPDEIENIGYYKLSEIRLEYRLCDQDMFSDEEDEVII